MSFPNCRVNHIIQYVITLLCLLNLQSLSIGVKSDLHTSTLIIPKLFFGDREHWFLKCWRHQGRSLAPHLHPAGKTHVPSSLTWHFSRLCINAFFWIPRPHTHTSVTSLFPSLSLVGAVSQRKDRRHIHLPSGPLKAFTFSSLPSSHCSRLKPLLLLHVSYIHTFTQEEPEDSDEDFDWSFPSLHCFHHFPHLGHVRAAILTSVRYSLGYIHTLNKFRSLS